MNLQVPGGLPTKLHLASLTFRSRFPWLPCQCGKPKVMQSTQVFFRLRVPLITPHVLVFCLSLPLVAQESRYRTTEELTPRLSTGLALHLYVPENVMSRRTSSGRLIAILAI